MLDLTFMGVDRDYPRLYALCRINFTIDSFGAARLARAYIIEGNADLTDDLFNKVKGGRWQVSDDVADAFRLGILGNTLAGKCMERFTDIVTPGPVFTYEAVFAFLQGDYGRASAASQQALASDVQIAYDGDFDHPLPWAIATAHRLEDDDSKADLAEVARRLRGGFSAETQAALDLFVDDPAAENAHPNCVTAGCHFLTAQYLLGLDAREAARRELDAGEQLCIEAQSIPCTAIRSALTNQGSGSTP